MPRDILALALIVALAPAAVAQQWQVRLGHLPDQTAEWTEMGRVPAWDVSIEDGDAPLIEISGDDEGAYRGLVMVGRPWTVPEEGLREISASLEMQTWCEIDDPVRSGAVWIALIEPDQWDELGDPDAPAEAPVLQLWRDVDWALALARIRGQGEDLEEWTPVSATLPAASLRGRAGEELVLAVVWGAYHFNPEWAKFRNLEVTAMTEADARREFLEGVDADRPGLEQFTAAMEAGDLDAAEVALGEYMRTRTSPEPPPTPEGTERAVTRAEEILDHVFRLVGTPPTDIGETIEWNEDPHNYDQWAISLNRHSHWVTLGRAYAATGDERYAREFVAQLNSWIDAMPVAIGKRYVQGPWTMAGRVPLTLDAGIRMAQTWWPAYYYFRESPSFDARSQARMMRSFARHAKYLMKRDHFRPDSNWGAMETNGLFHVGVMLPEMKQSEEWTDTARERLVEAMNAQVYPDGAQIELTPGYHGVTVRNFLGALELARRTQTPLPDEWVAAMERMFTYYAAIAMPDNRTPALNDSGWGGVAGMLREGLELFPARDDWRWVASQGGEGSPPEFTSVRLPYAGWHMMRTGWAPDDRYLHFDAGPFGSGHQHEDKLSVLLYAAGRRMLTEPGNYAYDASDWRKYVLSTRAHNTLLVDGLEQNRRHVLGFLPQRPVVNVTWVAEAPADTRWFSDGEFDFAEGVYASGYGPEREVQVTHTRQVLFAKPEYWLIADRLEPQDDGEHKYEALFHLDAQQVEVDPEAGTITADYGGPQLRIAAVGDVVPEIEIVQGVTEPQVQGWLPTGRHNELRPIPTAVFRWQATGPSTMLFALLPREQGEDWPLAEVASLSADASTVALSGKRPDGARDIFLSRAQADAPAAVGPVGTDADAAFARIAADGALERAFQAGGSYIREE